MPSWIFETTASPDRFLGLVREGLEALDFTVQMGRAHHLAARRGTLRLFVHVANESNGVLVQARVAVLGLEPPDRGEGIVYEVARDAQYELIEVP